MKNDDDDDDDDDDGDGDGDADDIWRCFMLCVGFFLNIYIYILYDDLWWYTSLYVARLALFGYTRFRFDVFGAALPTLFRVWWVPRAQVERRQKAWKNAGFR